MVALYFMFIQPMQEKLSEIDMSHADIEGIQQDLEELEEKIDQLESIHALRCEIKQSEFNILAQGKEGDANTARGVANRYRALRDYLASQNPPESLSPVDQARMEEKDQEADRLSAEAKAFEESATIVCQVPAQTL